MPFSVFSSVRKTVFAALLGFGLGTLSPTVSASHYYFYVENNSDSRITELEVSEDKRKWGSFDIGRGIGRGKSSKLYWDDSTNDEDCRQWIRARFADGSVSEPARFYFCSAMDDPIIFD